MVRVLLFAGLSQAVGASVSLPSNMCFNTIKDIKDWLEEQYPEIKELLQRSMVAVNQEYANNDTKIVEADEIAFIPPVSGG